jgi:uncharacterized protein
LIRWLTFLTVLLTLPLWPAPAQTGSALQLKAGQHLITAELAATPDSRDRGLMRRKSLAADRGMLFIFPEAHRHCMWMKNTDLPLSVAFIADNGTIINIADMKPQTEDYHCADRPVRYALEMNAGWFGKKGLGPGAVITGIEKAPGGK